jgi:hypothetical protein
MKKTLLIAALAAALPLLAADTPDLAMQQRIREEGFRHSQVMEIASGLMDGIGPRLTGSPNMQRANEWTMKKLEEFGLTNAHLEAWSPFGRGWAYESCSVRLVSPDVAQLEALPRAWSASTNGPVRAQLVHVKATKSEELEKYKDKVAGKIILLGDAPEFKPHEKPQYERYNEKTLADLEEYEIPGKPRFTREDFLRRRAFFRELLQFLTQEKAVATIIPGGADFGNIHVQGAGTQKEGEGYPVPALVMSDEQYARLVRLLDEKKTPELEIDVKSRYFDAGKQYNTVAEIPGTSPSGEVVMLGAHLDSWHGGTGATDNGAGVVATMEAVRILKALGVAPKRTIRIALWSGEEEGLLGSRGYVAQHFGSRPEPAGEEKDVPAYLRTNKGPLTVKPEQAKVSGYFNLDNGTGKIRGVYLQENIAVRPIFESWIEPMKDLGVTTLTARNTGGTDHLSFDDVGIPGFQFIQDDVEYEQRTHHTNFDTYERLQRDDLMQAAVVIASFVWEAANRPEMLPRKPLPK